jgi:hypothetical protein
MSAQYKPVKYSKYHQDLNRILKNYDLAKALAAVKQDPDFAEQTETAINYDVLPAPKDDLDLSKEQYDLGYAYINLVRKLAAIQEILNNKSDKPELMSHAETAYQKGLGFVRAILAQPEKDIAYINLTADLLDRMHKVLVHPGEKSHLNSFKSGINSLNSRLELEGTRGSLRKAGRIFASWLLSLAGALVIALTTTSVAGLVFSGVWRAATHKTKDPNWGPLSLGWRTLQYGMHRMNGPTLFQQKTAQKLSNELDTLKQDVEAIQKAEKQTAKDNKKLLTTSTPTFSKI